MIGTRPASIAPRGVHLLLFKDRLFFLADTTVNIDPDAEDAGRDRRDRVSGRAGFEVEPRVAMLSFSNFGSNSHPLPKGPGGRRDRQGALAPAGHRRRDAGRHRGRAVGWPGELPVSRI
jgi:hypothetical protein